MTKIEMGTPSEHQVIINCNSAEAAKRLFGELLKAKFEACGQERPDRKILCQLPKGHSGSHQATAIFWE